MSQSLLGKESYFSGAQAEWLEYLKMCALGPLIHFLELRKALNSNLQFLLQFLSHTRRDFCASDQQVV